jgi:acetolactate synthase-1/2/3 large subunit
LYRPDLAINASPVRMAAALAALSPPKKRPWRKRTESAHAEYLAWGEVSTPQPGGVNLGTVMVQLRDLLPDDAIICNGAGNYAAWIHRFYRFRRFATHIAPTSASMGYGVPAAIAMKRLNPERTVVSINGDGDFLMNGQEFAIAVQYGLPIIVIICDNGSYGTIRMHQEREFPGRISATDLHNPDFALYAEAFAAAQASGLSSIIHLKIATDAITPGASLAQIREAALARR